MTKQYTIQKIIFAVSLVVAILCLIPKQLLAAPSTPSTPSVSATSSSSLDISWSSVSGATEYKLYRSTSTSSTSFSQIYWGTDTSYTDSGSHLSDSTRYYYKVRAGNSSGWSGFSSYSYDTTWAPIPSTPSAPSVSATSSTSLDISWSSVTDATEYKLYRSTSSSSGYSQIYWGSSRSYTDSGSHLSASTRYYYKVEAGNSSGWSSQSSYGYDTTWAAVPSTPSAPSVSATGATSLDISWSSVSGATEYKLYRSTSSSSGYSQIYWGSSRSYTDSGSHLSASTRYYYKVEAGNSSGWSSQSSYGYDTTWAAIPSTPSAPSVSATGATSLDISWSSVSGAAEYKLYRSTSSSSGYSQIYWGSSTSYTDSGSHLSASTRYYYKVEAGNSSGWSSQSSYGYDTTWAAIPSTPSAPSVSATGETSLDISWSSVTDATEYKLYRSTSSSSGYSQIYWGSSTSYTDSGSHLSDSTTYYYKVEAGNSSGWSAQSSYGYDTTWVAVPAIPSAPTVTATGETSIDISWSSVTSATEYKLFRSTSETGTFSQIYWGSDLSYSDSGTHLSASTTYYYKLTAGNSSGHSDYSSASSATTLAGIPAIPTAPTVDSTTSMSVTLSWLAVFGATEYKLHRSTTETGSYTQIFWAPDFSYLDMGAHIDSSTTYYYKLTAGNSSGWSDYSSAVSATTLASLARETSSSTQIFVYPFSDDHDSTIACDFDCHAGHCSGCQGVDYASEGEIVYAPISGTAVVDDGHADDEDADDCDGYGNSVTITSSDGHWTVILGHFSTGLLISDGEEVIAGETALGYTSNSGWTDGENAVFENDLDGDGVIEPYGNDGYARAATCSTTNDDEVNRTFYHLHLEVEYDGVDIDPYDFDPDGDGVGETIFIIDEDGSYRYPSEECATPDSDSIFVAYPTSADTTPTDVEVTEDWEDLLAFETEISSALATVSVTKSSTADTSEFTSSGTMYLKVGSAEAYGANHDSAYLCGSEYSGDTSVCDNPTTSLVTLTDDFSSYCESTFPKELYVRYESDDGGYTASGPMTVYQIFDGGSDTSVCDVDSSSFFSVSTSSTTDTPEGSSLEGWENALELSVTLDDSTALFTVTTTGEDGVFDDRGRIYLQVGGEEYSLDAFHRAEQYVAAGDDSVSFVDDFSVHCGYPKNYYVRYESSAGGYTVVGPITVDVTTSGDDGVTDVDLFLERREVAEDDIDEDGYTVSTGDCNDYSAEVNPDAEDVCEDGIDQDCSGSDASCGSSGSTDDDGDGYTTDTDCDDTDSSINPGATEICDGVDNDCDTDVDEGLSTTTYYLDADGDGYGKVSSSQDACAMPTGYVEDNTDCDDADATIYPGAEEIEDGKDNDCNGMVDDGDYGSSLVLDLSLDASLVDDSEYAHSVTSTSVVSTTGIINEGLEFDGVASAVVIPDAESLDITEALTVQAWVYPTNSSDNTYQRIVQRGAGIWGLYVKNGYAQFYVDTTDSGGSWQYCRWWIRENQWSHVAGAYDGSNLYIYINGELKDTCAHSGSLDVTNSDLFVGANDASGSQVFSGIIDEVKIYNEARSLEEIVFDMENEGEGYLVLDYNFDDGTATDQSAFANNGTLSSSAVVTDGLTGQSVLFDGAANIEVPDAGSLDIKEALTIEAWVYPTNSSSGSDQRIIQRAQGTWGLYVKNGYITFYTDTTNDGGSWQHCRWWVKEDQWTHVAGVYDGSNMYIYRNGELKDTCAQTGELDTTSQSMHIGANDGTGSFGFEGKIDNVKIYSRALEVEDIQTEMQDSMPENVLSYDFDDGSTTLATDASLADNLGTINNANIVTGYSGYGLEFDGATSFMEIVGASTLDIENELTLEAWVYPTNSSSSSDQRIIQRAQGTWGMYVKSGYITFYTDTTDSGGVWQYCRWWISEDQWTHVAGVYDGTNMYIYRNGELKDTCSQTGVLDTSTQNMFIGSNNNTPTHVFEGIIDDVKVYRRALTQEQIALDAGL